jgi:hypothetical protein
MDSGLLSLPQATALRADLNRLAAEEDSARLNGSLTYSKALLLGYELDSITSRLLPYTTNYTVQPVIASQLMVVGGKMTLLDAISARKQQLLRRVDDEYSAGRLSTQQVSRLKNDLDKIAATETKYTKDGVLSNSKDRKLSVKLDELQASLDSDVAETNHKRAKIGLKVD